MTVVRNREQACLDMDGQFLVRQIYDDGITYDIVLAAERVLGKQVRGLFQVWELGVTPQQHQFQNHFSKIVGYTSPISNQLLFVSVFLEVEVSVWSKSM
jgi:hypothetical protein